MPCELPEAMAPANFSRQAARAPTRQCARIVHAHRDYKLLCNRNNSPAADHYNFALRESSPLPTA